MTVLTSTAGQKGLPRYFSQAFATISKMGRGLVLRTQTSPLQIRTMLTNEPPIYIVSPGRTFRAEGKSPAPP